MVVVGAVSIVGTGSHLPTIGHEIEPLGGQLPLLDLTDVSFPGKQALRPR